MNSEFRNSHIERAERALWRNVLFQFIFANLASLVVVVGLLATNAHGFRRLILSVDGGYWALGLFYMSLTMLLALLGAWIAVMRQAEAARPGDTPRTGSGALAPLRLTIRPRRR